MERKKKLTKVTFFACDKSLRTLLNETVSVEYVSDLISTCNKYSEMIEPQDITLTIEDDRLTVVFLPKLSFAD